MRKIIIILFLTYIFFIPIFGQDTIYCYPYPDGIVTNHVDSNRHSYICYPINNSLIKVVINKHETSKIKYSSGKIYDNQNYETREYQVFPTNPNTGEIVYEDVLSYPNTKKEDLYQALIMNIPNIPIKYNLVAKDDINFSFQKYYGSFFAYFAGDQYTVSFTLNVYFKNNKIKYNYSNFIAVFIKNKIHQYETIIGTQKGTLVNFNDYKNLSKVYARGLRKTDNKKFWKPINNFILQDIKGLNRVFLESNPKIRDDW